MTLPPAATAPRTPETGPASGLGSLAPVDASLGHPRGSTGQVWQGAMVAPWLLGTMGGRLTCDRCGAVVDTGPCGLCADEDDALFVEMRFVWEHVRCGGGNG